MNNVAPYEPIRSTLDARADSARHRWLCAALLAGLAGCSSTDGLLSGDKVDYRAAATKTPTLEVPPDLTQLSRDSRYLSQDASGSFSAATYQAQPSAAATAAVVPEGKSDLRIERTGNDRWLVTSLTPEQLWPQLQAFWRERGFTLTVEQADVGVMETEWNENRAKLPQDFIRSTIGRFLDSVYSTGERDKFRTRLERTSAGSEVYISHRGMIEVATGPQKDNTMWQPRPADPELEAEMLRRLLLKLGAKEEEAQTLLTATAPTAPRARLVAGQGSTIEVDDGFDRAWRRVGVALDRSGFTVEDRDRVQGVYYVRYADTSAGKDSEPGFFGKLFGRGKSDPNNVARYRVQVKSTGDRSMVTVLNAEGNADKGGVTTRIVGLLVEDLK